MQDRLIGRRFGRLVVIKFASKDKQKKSRWQCACDCGQLKIAYGQHLKKGRTRSCGCLRGKPRIEHVAKHRRK